VEIERNTFSLEPPLQTCDHGEKPLRIVVSVGKREVPTTAVVALVRDVHDEADARGPERFRFPSTPEIEEAGDDLAE